MKIIISNIIGMLGIFANTMIYQQKYGKNLILWKLFSDILWVLHYFSLSAYTGCAIAAIGIFREIIFYNNKKSWAKSNLWFVIFLLCSILSALFTWKSIFSILPAIASVISVISFWKKKPGLSRILAYPISLSMLTYDVICNSYVGIINELLTILSVTIGTIRYKKKNTQQGGKEQNTY